MFQNQIVHEMHYPCIRTIEKCDHVIREGIFAVNENGDTTDKTFTSEHDWWQDSVRIPDMICVSKAWMDPLQSSMEESCVQQNS